MLNLPAASYGQATQEAARLGALAAAWDTAGRPGTDRLRIAAYPAGAAPPDTGARIHRAPHTTFAVSSPVGHCRMRTTP